ncbi:MAG: branched-chain amino acid transport system ATP-binding protein [Actinomycetota bacterium]|nr:branched-chain amino acid transport system ATP-binding protein [Actinomycetota bacterium]
MSEQHGPILEVENLHVHYAGAVALAGASLRVLRGELVALVGANGAGKSSLIKSVAGLHAPTSGRVRFEGRDITGMPAHKVARLGMSLVPEGRRLFGRLTVRQNLLLGDHRAKDRPARERRLEYVHDLFPVLAERAGQRANTLSGGEQQMVAIARALMRDPALLVLDEPSLGVAPFLVERVLEVIERLHADGMTVVLVEQNLRAALTIATRGVVLQAGRVVNSGPARELLESKEVRRAYLGL